MSKDETFYWFFGLCVVVLIVSAFAPKQSAEPVKSQSSYTYDRFRDEGYSESDADRAERIVKDYVERARTKH